MTGCTAAIAARDRHREIEMACPDLAYGLHKRGGKCQRLGGPRVCGDCLADLARDDAARLTVREIQTCE